MPKALFFLPDISGFTSFVTRTEQVHSRHLIAELLERVIAADALALTLQEIEGDAVFFLRPGTAPTRTELYEQARAMFLAFHTHLQIIERDNVCQCGACRTASGLTLKFIAHYGEMEQTAVAGRTTVSGTDVILVHRLMKNTVPAQEYLLLTDTVPGGAADAQNASSALAWHEGIEEIEHFPPQAVQWTSLASLREAVPPAETLPPAPFPSGRAFVLRRHIRAPLLLVHDLLTDPEKKKEFTPGLRESRSDTPINRVRSTHTCVFDDFEIRFVTRESRREENALVFTESAEATLGFSLVFDYRLTGDERETQILLRILPGVADASRTKGLRGRAGAFMQPIFIRYTAWTNMRRFARYCERVSEGERMGMQNQ